MPLPSPALELLGQMVYQFTLIRPYIPTYIHLIISALFPIYAGSHASLSRPSSAAKPPRRKTKSTKEQTDHEDDEDGGETGEQSQRMEGLAPSDAILYPVLTGCVLAGLYFLIKWLKDPAILNKILNWYLSVFGVLSIAKLLSDCMTTAISYGFPTKYYESRSIWEIHGKQRYASTRDSDIGRKSVLKPRKSPLPGLASRLPLPAYIMKALWNFRDFLTQPLYILEAYIYGVLERTRIPVGPQGLTSFFIAVASVLYFNLVDKPWWLTNLLGFSFSYSALQLMSPTTFWTGTLVLTSLFFYDIYFVFFTPLMITVATKLDIPVKLLFPRPPGVNDDTNKKPLSMLGLGDVVLPGIMIGLALRFDLYLFYLKKQKRQQTNWKDGSDGQSDELEHASIVHSEENKTKEDKKSHNGEEVVKTTYRSATGGWGERYWLGNKAVLEGGSFPKTYFHASVVGYIIGMICTLCVMHVYQHGQPALLYLVPGVLCSLWGTALFRGEIKTMWAYTEAEEVEKEQSDKNGQPTGPSGSRAPHDDRGTEATENQGLEKGSVSESKDHGEEIPHEEPQPAPTKTKQSSKTTVGRPLFLFAITLPPSSQPLSAAAGANTALPEEKKSLTGDLSPASTDESTPVETPQSSSSSVHSTLVRRSSDASDAEPALKRARLD
ncbi:hypothetical protein MMC34_000618 [Xylographa carneopallida]|nr:hypothetical protein [Xylographa carneopallida]